MTLHKIAINMRQRLNVDKFNDAIICILLRMPFFTAHAIDMVEWTCDRVSCERLTGQRAYQSGSCYAQINENVIESPLFGLRLCRHHLKSVNWLFSPVQSVQLSDEVGLHPSQYG